MHRKTSEYFETIFLKISLWFPKRTQHAIPCIGHSGKSKKALDQGKEYGALLIDLYSCEAPLI